MTATKHPNGFWKVTLGSWRGWKLRLHVWSWMGVQDVHDHRWDFWSLPLFGFFWETRWGRSTGIPNHREWQCLPDDGRPGRRERAQKRSCCCLMRIRSYLRVMGLPYACRAGEIHSLEGCGPAVTLVLTGPPKGQEAKVFTWEAPWMGMSERI